MYNNDNITNNLIMVYSKYCIIIIIDWLLTVYTVNKYQIVIIIRHISQL